MGADYSFEPISIETYAPQFIGHNKVFLRQCVQNIHTSDELSKVIANKFCGDLFSNSAHFGWHRVVILKN